MLQFLILATFLSVSPVKGPPAPQGVNPRTGFQIMVPLPCNDSKVILDLLHDKYREVATGAGTSKGEQLRLFESHDAGDEQTWTLVISNPNGVSCIIRGGQNWVTVPDIIKGDPL